AIVGVEDLSATSHLEEKLRRLESAREAGIQIFQSLDHDLDAERIHVAEGSAAERWKADAEDRAHITVPRGLDDSVLQAARGFIEHRQHGSLLHLDRRHLGNYSSLRCRRGGYRFD